MVISVSLRRPPQSNYSITQLCREFGLTARALRFYEEQGLVEPQRRHTTRIYSVKDRVRISLIVRARAVGLSLRDIRDLFEAYDEGGVAAQRAMAAQVFARRLDDLREERRRADQSIATLEAACADLEARVVAAA